MADSENFGPNNVFWQNKVYNILIECRHKNVQLRIFNIISLLQPPRTLVKITHWRIMMNVS